MQIKHPYKDEMCDVIVDPIFGEVAVAHDRFGRPILLKADKPTRLIAKQCKGCGKMLPRSIFTRAGKKENFYVGAVCTVCSPEWRVVNKLREAVFEEGVLTSLECYACGKQRTLDWFSEHPKAQHGYQTQCKWCLNNKRRLGEGLSPLSEEEYAPREHWHVNREAILDEKQNPVALKCKACGKVKSTRFFRRNNMMSAGYEWCCKRCIYALDYESEVGVSYKKYKQDLQGNVLEIRCPGCGEWYPPVAAGEEGPRSSVFRAGSYCTACAALSTVTSKRAFYRALYHYFKRARRAGARADYTIENLFRMRDWFNCKCTYCGSNFTLLEHFIPQCEGGGFTVSNILPACVWCNRAKGQSSAKDFLGWLYRGDTPQAENTLRKIEEYFKFVNST